MFERFTRDARELVLQACAEARRLGAPAVGTEHLLIAAVERCGPHPFLLDYVPPLAPVRILGRPGFASAPVTAEKIRSLLVDDDGDAAALETIGISLPEVRRRIEEAFGPHVWDEAATGGGRGPFTSAAKKALELALREALETKVKRLRAHHVLRALLKSDATARRIVSELDADPDTVYRTVRDAEEQLVRFARR